MPSPRIALLFSPGCFSTSLACLEVLMIVGARGSISCSWDGEWGTGSQAKRKHDFGLDEPAFERARAALTQVPEPSWVVDDVPSRELACHGPEGTVGRSRYLMGPVVDGPHADERRRHELAFDRVWRELVEERVRPVLVELAVPHAVIDHACGSSAR